MSQLLNLLKNLQSFQGQVATIAKQGNDHLALISSSSFPKWIVDTGATDHMTSESRNFTSYSPLAGNNRIRTANNSSAPIAGTGTVPLTRDLKLDSVLHVPHLAYNLLSISKLTKHANCSAHFFATHCIFQDLSSGKMIGTAKEHDGLYYLDDSSASALSSQIKTYVSPTLDNNLMLWHRRMGHPSFQYLQKLFPQFSFNKDVNFHCETCELAKHHRTTFPPTTYHSTRPFSIIHSDVWGPSRVPNRTGSKYFVTFIDDHSRMCWVYLLKEKSDVFNIFVEFFRYVQT